MSIAVAATVTPADFKAALGSFASGVTVITGLHNGIHAGITVSAFSSVSLSPPLVLFCIDTHAKALPVLQGSQQFGISILAQSQHPIANHFARSANGFNHSLCHAWHDSLVITDAAAHIIARPVACHIHGDHHVFIAGVEALATNHQAAPLAYWRGHYQQVSPCT